MIYLYENENQRKRKMVGKTYMNIQMLIRLKELLTSNQLSSYQPKQFLNCFHTERMKYSEEDKLHSFAIFFLVFIIILMMRSDFFRMWEKNRIEMWFEQFICRFFLFCTFVGNTLLLMGFYLLCDDFSNFFPSLYFTVR